MTSSPDPSDQVPVSDAEVDIRSPLAHGSGHTDASGFFSVLLDPGLRPLQTITVSVNHRDYKPFTTTLRPSDAPVLVWLQPLAPKETKHSARETIISGIRVRYTVRESSATNVGTVAKTFQAANIPDRPCAANRACSPDGRWAAGEGSLQLAAPENGRFTNVRVSCIAGPCPFTQIDPVTLNQDGRSLQVTARSWSSTATFLVEADTVRVAINDVVRQSYPVIFGPSLSFTLPGTAAGPSIEAEENGQYVVFPLGPALHLSWAECSSKVNPDHSRLYSCEVKAGFRFQ